MMANSVLLRRTATQLLSAAATAAVRNGGSRRACGSFPFPSISRILQHQPQQQPPCVIVCGGILSKRWNSDTSKPKEDSTENNDKISGNGSSNLSEQEDNKMVPKTQPPRAGDDATTTTTTDTLDEDTLTKYTKEVPIKMPDFGAGGGRVLVWYKKEGELVLPEDLLCEIEMENFAFDMTADEEHPVLLKQILLPANTPKRVAPDTAICITMHQEHKGSIASSSTKGMAASNASANAEEAAFTAYDNDEKEDEEEGLNKKEAKNEKEEDKKLT